MATRSSQSKRNVSKRRLPRKSIWDSIQIANERAQHRANLRAGKRKRLTSIHAAISTTPHEWDYTLPISQRILRKLLALPIVILSVISTSALFTITDHTGDQNFWGNLMLSRPFLFFGVGCVLMIGWFWTRLLHSFFLYLYVLGHELTHVLFIYLCGGKVSGFNASLDGGYVMTNKSNILIALSPYFIPFWSFVVLGLSGVIRLFWDIPYHDYALYLLIGFTWTFHLGWTLWMIPRDQPDLKENDTLFSLSIISLANVLLLATMLCLVPGGLDFRSYCYHWINLAHGFTRFCDTLITQLL